MAQIKRIPILLLTGFLGSGKTTLLRSLLENSDAADTAVIVNEFGEVGLDHHLLVGASETVFVLENGCVCCSVRDDLDATLEELFWARTRREIPRFSRVVIETTGLAEPDGVLSLLRENSLATERYEWAAVVATVDGVAGNSTIDRYSEAVAQVESADRLIITKTDVASRAMIDALEQRLRILNPRAVVLRSAKGAACAPLAALLEPTRSAGERTVARRRGQPPAPIHSPRVTSCWLHFGAPMRRADFLAAFSTLTNRLGPKLLRAKGLLEFTAESALAVFQHVGDGPPQIEDAGIARDKGLSPGLVIFTTGVEEHDVIDAFVSAGLRCIAHPGAAHHHPSDEHHAHPRA